MWIGATEIKSTAEEDSLKFPNSTNINTNCFTERRLSGFDLLQTNEVPVVDLVVKIRDLASPIAESRSFAEQLFVKAGSGASPILMVQLNNYRKTRKDRALQFGLVFAVSLVGSAVVRLSGLAEKVGEPNVWLITYAFMALGTLGFIYYLLGTREETAYNRALEKYDPKEVLGVLAEYGYGAVSDREYYESVLQKLLAKVNSENVSAMTTSQRLSLFRLLELIEFLKDTVNSTQQIYLEGLLSAMERIQDKRALPYIQKFIDLGPDCDRGKSIKEHARTVVSKLSATE